ncbi:transposase [Acetobacter sp.]|uniref:IS110 family transposase n=1 Tax=Acetobacter sp. TaxID=440 RepID=UPI002588B322|nr:transposase [Acetobacter sp.]MCC6105744.1 transposase [Acetobacter sp.]
MSRDWLDGFCLPEKQRFRFQNSPDGYARLLEILQGMSDDLKVGFEATGGQEWALWRILISMGINAVQLPPAQIKAFALSMGKRAKTDQIDAELIARFMAFRPEAGRALPDEKLQRLRALTVRRAQMVDARKRLSAQISARRKQGVSAELEDMDRTLSQSRTSSFHPWYRPGISRHASRRNARTRPHDSDRSRCHGRTCTNGS